MPPIHPAIVHFPIALLVLSVVADIFGFLYQSESLRGAGWWSLLGAASVARLRLPPGFTI